MNLVIGFGHHLGNNRYSKLTEEPNEGRADLSVKIEVADPSQLSDKTFDSFEELQRKLTIESTMMVKMAEKVERARKKMNKSHEAFEITDAINTRNGSFFSYIMKQKQLKLQQRKIAEAYAKNRFNDQPLGMFYTYRIAALFDQAHLGNIVAMNILLQHYRRISPEIEERIVFDIVDGQEDKTFFRPLSNELLMSCLAKWSQFPKTKVAKAVLANGAQIVGNETKRKYLK